MDMPMDVFRALIADTISTMSVEELRNIILQTPDKELGAVGAAVLAEKGKKVGMMAVGAVKKKSRTKTVKNTPGKQTPTPVGSSSKRKRKSRNTSIHNNG
jgi:predicted hydrolase (HD superfamily)